jgi:hypothetical protein
MDCLILLVLNNRMTKASRDRYAKLTPRAQTHIAGFSAIC